MNLFIWKMVKTSGKKEQQFQVYRLAAEAMGMKKVVIRTADLGGEKTAECLDLGEAVIILR